MKKKLSHLNNQGEIHMVDISHKSHQNRLAIASGKIFMEEQTIALIKESNIKKGDVITTAKIAGIQASKYTSILIPLCHQLNIEKVEVDIDIKSTYISVRALVKSLGKTGVEIEALTAVQIALLTIYDMCKAVDTTMIITDVKLLSKEKFPIDA